MNRRVQISGEYHTGWSLGPGTGIAPLGREGRPSIPVISETSSEVPTVLISRSVSSLIGEKSKKMDECEDLKGDVSLFVEEGDMGRE
jgi:hypothetical protein